MLKDVNIQTGYICPSFNNVVLFFLSGLTPHLGAGMRQFSKDNIVQQCGLLDSKGIRRIEAVKNLTDLLDTNKPPEMDTMLLTVPSRSSSSVKGTFRFVDPFGECIIIYVIKNHCGFAVSYLKEP